MKDSQLLKRLSPKHIKRVQEIAGTILYYYQVTEPMPLAALSSLSAQQSNTTDATK